METKTQKLKGSTIFLYTMAAFGFNMLWAVQSQFIGYYYTQSVGMSAAVMGLITLLARLWDGVNDPLMGTLADKTNTKYGRYRPYLLWGILPLMASSILLFTSPSGMAPGAKIAYAAVTYIFFGMSYTFINIPYMTLQSTLTQDPDQRTKLINLKGIGVLAGAMIASFLTPSLATSMGDRGYTTAMVIYSVVMALGCVLAFIGTKPYIANEIAAGNMKQGMPKQKITMKKRFSVITSNKPLFIVMVVFILTNTLSGMLGGVGLYYTQYYMARPDLIATMSLLGTLSMVIVPLIIGVLSKRVEKRALMSAGFLLSAVMCLAQYFLPGGSVGAIMALTVAKGLGVGISSTMIFSLVADCVDYGAYKTGEKLGGMVFSTATFSQKAGAAIGSGLIGGVLTLIGFVSGGGAQGAGTVQGIRFINTLLPGLVYLACGIIIAFYPLTRAKMKEITAVVYAKQEEA